MTSKRKDRAFLSDEALVHPSKKRVRICDTLIKKLNRQPKDQINQYIPSGFYHPIWAPIFGQPDFRTFAFKLAHPGSHQKPRTLKRKNSSTVDKILAAFELANSPKMEIDNSQESRKKRRQEITQLKKNIEEETAKTKEFDLYLRHKLST